MIPIEDIHKDLQECGCDNTTILDSYTKAHSVLHKHDNILVSVSGGSDSDLMIDICKRLDPDNEKCRYVWFDTGLEYEATKKHLKYLQSRYGITIERECAIKPIPTCCKEIGQPFINKYVSWCIEILQKHDFQWEDLPFEVLTEKYPNCRVPLKWWCNCAIRDEKRNGYLSRFEINYNRYLKEFMIKNPPAFKISSKCCDYAKKKVSKQLYDTGNYDLVITGVRKAEGGIRASIYKSCFTQGDETKADTYRPIFWYKNEDKAEYEKYFGIKHSDCYEKYGFVRTGCCCCPYATDLKEELKAVELYEPKLYLAVNNIFKDSYEYTRKFRDFQKEMRLKDRKGLRRLF